MLKWLDDHFEEFVLLILLALMTLIMGIQIIARYVFQNSLSWSEELTRFLFVWSAFIGVSYTTKKGTSIRITNFIDVLPIGIKKIVEKVSLVILLAFFALLAFYGLQVVIATYNSGQVSAAMGIPMWLVNLSIMVGGILSFIRTLQVLLSGNKDATSVEIIGGTK